jgi:hypothetical protein
MTGIANACLSCLSAVDRWCHITACLGPIGARSRDGIYETTLADNEREAVSDLLGYLENVRGRFLLRPLRHWTDQASCSVPRPISSRGSLFEL